MIGGALGAKVLAKGMTWWILAALLAVGPLCAALTSEQRQLNLQSFEYVWTVIRDKHWETKPGGLDWQAIHDEFKPKIEAADSMEAVRAVMNQMLDRLHQSHFGIVPADLYSNLDASRGIDLTAGIDVRVVGCSSAGHIRGSRFLGRGARCTSRLGDSEDRRHRSSPLVAKLNKTYAGSTLRDLTLRRAMSGASANDAAPSIVVEFLDDDGRHVSKTLAQASPKGELVQFGYLNPMHVWINSSRVGAGRVGGGTIGYVAFNVFLDPQRLMTSFGDAVQTCHNVRWFHRRSARKSRRHRSHGHGHGGLVHRAAGPEARHVIHARQHAQIRRQSPANYVLRVRSRSWWTARRRPHPRSWRKD